LEISPETGITLKDTITHQKMPLERKYISGTDRMQRMVSVGDMLYTLSFNQIKIYNLNKEEIIKTVSIPKVTY
jgi:inhibitor of cysteine peptidase